MKRPIKRMGLGELMAEVELLPVSEESRRAVTTIINPNTARVRGVIAKATREAKDAVRLKEIGVPDERNPAAAEMDSSVERVLEALERPHPAVVKAAESLMMLNPPWFHAPEPAKEKELEAVKTFLLGKLRRSRELPGEQFSSIASGLGVMSRIDEKLASQLTAMLDEEKGANHYRALLKEFCLTSERAALPHVSRLLRGNEPTKVKNNAVFAAYLLAVGARSGDAMSLLNEAARGNQAWNKNALFYLRSAARKLGVI